MLYIVGKLLARSSDWEIAGVFSTEERARTCCVGHPNYFIGPIEIDVQSPEGTHAWPGLYYPELTAI